MQTSHERPAIKPRDPGLDFDETVPRHWFGGNALATHIANGVNLLFPAGERFFVRSVHHYLDKLEDPALRAQVKGFFAQEGRHARTHERFFERLEEQGYEIKPFLRVYEKIAYGILEPAFPPAFRLAVTAAAEHFTAIMAENALRERFLERAHPALRDLLFWHAAEEIEHRAVAFDVLGTVAPSYALRVAGMALAASTLAAFWIAGTLVLLEQDRRRGNVDLRAELRKLREHPIGQRVFLRGIKSYLRRDFHPLEAEIDGLARQWLEAKGMA
ncbi:metal-dependent hydrolase [Polyangium jinanense]|uniref:Metal-dependent hydrolase n=1 Tax=Polyangium jinanense TaxID=2829994 RepID=A0A9X4AYL3_9BACT|nr:metal-dependent hydrolase [Polyangium jinanense]MDC3956772.1 metal-dependent hydrolase [Polyangium jinanense]MDC3987232.1 metal-dependent hydrolase [Polyangium jinanense]